LMIVVAIPKSPMGQVHYTEWRYSCAVTRGSGRELMYD